MQRDPNFAPDSSELMQGIVRDDFSDGKNVIFVRSRETGDVIGEKIPQYVVTALNTMYNNFAGRLLVDTKITKKLMTKFANDKGKEYDLKSSRSQIKPFIAQHNIDTTILVKKSLKDFSTFNDFFARAINCEKYRPMSNDENDIVSPADCRMMVWNNILNSTKFWIKGKKFTVPRLLDSRKGIAHQFEGGGFCIARLAPQDYHRWHWPVSGTITRITHWWSFVDNKSDCSESICGCLYRE